MSYRYVTQLSIRHPTQGQDAGMAAAGVFAATGLKVFYWKDLLLLFDTSGVI